MVFRYINLKTYTLKIIDFFKTSDIKRKPLPNEVKKLVTIAPFT